MLFLSRLSTFSSFYARERYKKIGMLDTTVDKKKKTLKKQLHENLNVQ